jgi:hypothetical protein
MRSQEIIWLYTDTVKAMIIVENHFSAIKSEHFHEIVKKEKELWKKFIHLKNIKLLFTA